MFENYTIQENKTILDALRKINDIVGSDALTLFVINPNNEIIGTLTDGDVRRSLLNGDTLDTTIGKIAHRDFTYLETGTYDVLQIHNAKLKGIELLPVLNGSMQIVDIVNLKKQKSYLPIDAVLMAGGKGERLRPLTEKIPKPLVKVGDKCIIDYNIDRLIQYGVKHINVTVNYLKEQMHDHFVAYRNGIKVKTVEEPQYLGTIGGIRFVKEFKNDYILVMNSDLFTNIDFEDFFLHFKEHDAMMSVAAIPYNVSIPFGILDLDGRNIKGLLEKPKYNYYTNGGIYLMKKEALQYIPMKIFFNATDLIEQLIAKEQTVIRYPLNGTWIDIGQHADLEKAQDLIKHLK